MGRQKNKEPSHRSIALDLERASRQRHFVEDIDLHGKKRSDVKHEVSLLIDRHYTEGGTVRVTCGHGEGIIKQEVKDFLKSLPSQEYPYQINSFEEIGPYIYIHLE